MFVMQQEEPLKWCCTLY